MAGTLQVGTLVSSNNRSVSVDDIGSRSFAGGAGAYSLRNKIVDGRFDFWYEGTSQTSSGYGSSTMFLNMNVGSTKTTSRQSLSVLDLPMKDCPSAKYFLRTVVTSSSTASCYVNIAQRMENVGLFSGKTMTVSFYAKASAALKLGVDINQNISSTDYPSNGIIFNLSTAWQRYSYQIVVPTLTSTPSSTDFFALRFWYDLDSSKTGVSSVVTSGLGYQSGTFDIACVQLEEGSVATPFEELPIEISQTRVNRYFRYLSNSTGVAVSSSPTVFGSGSSTTTVYVVYPISAPMRTSSITISGSIGLVGATNWAITITGWSVYDDNIHIVGTIGATSSASAAYRAYIPASSYLSMDARL